MKSSSSPCWPLRQLEEDKEKLVAWTPRSTLGHSADCPANIANIANFTSIANISYNSWYFFLQNRKVGVTTHQKACSNWMCYPPPMIVDKCGHFHPQRFRIYGPVSAGQGKCLFYVPFVDALAYLDFTLVSKSVAGQSFGFDLTQI